MREGRADGSCVCGSIPARPIQHKVGIQTCCLVSGDTGVACQKGVITAYGGKDIGDHTTLLRKRNA
jgi:hypothetical protein